MQQEPILFYPPSSLRKYSIFYSIWLIQSIIFVTRRPFLNSRLNGLLFTHHQLTFLLLHGLKDPLYLLSSHWVHRLIELKEHSFNLSITREKTQPKKGLMLNFQGRPLPKGFDLLPNPYPSLLISGLSLSSTNIITIEN